MRFFFFQAEDGIRDLVRSRGLGDVYKRQAQLRHAFAWAIAADLDLAQDLLADSATLMGAFGPVSYTHLTLPTSDLV